MLMKAVVRPRSAIDVLVVGAGPAGSAAALTLARAGVRVRLIDRAVFPRDKLCGDTVNPGSLSILDRLGVADRVQARGLPITGMTVTGAGATVSADYPHGLRAMSLTRRCLDQLLLEAAAAAGALVHTGVGVSGPILEDGRIVGVRLAGTKQQRALRAPIVIAADGRGSRMAASVQLASYAQTPRRWAFGAYFSHVSRMSARGEMHIRRDAYVGVAPLPGGLTNVSVVLDGPSAFDVAQATKAGHYGDAVVERRLQPPRTHAAQQAFVRRTLDADVMLRDRFATAMQVSPVTVLGPLAVNARAAGCPGLLLAGDAAGFIDPMTGDGLRFALRGGELAAHAALDELASGRPAYRRLEAWRRREFQVKWRINRALRRVVGSPRAVGLAALVSTRWSAPVEYLIHLAGDVGLAQRQECPLEPWLRQA
jgi:flavin-dependent dehydrogenase